MEERILDEVAALTEKVNKSIASGAKEHDVPAFLDIAVGSIINVLLFGYRFDDDREEEFYRVKHLVSLFIKNIAHPLARGVEKNPTIFQYLQIFKQHLEKCRSYMQDLFSFYQSQIDEHLKTIDFETDDQPTDYAEAFLREKKKRDSEGLPHYYTHQQLILMCSDLFLAGQETTSNTLAWGVAYILHSPEVQQKIHEELDREIESDRFVTMADKPNLPYLNAVICETQRLANLLPQNLLHRTTKDVTIDGYFLPKGTCITSQISTVLYDEKVCSGI
jgi:cytochrome P450